MTRRLGRFGESLRRVSAVSVVVVAISTMGCGGGEESLSDETTVEAVLDGDTVDVVLPNGDHERLRLIGINAPEKGECFAEEATDALTDLLGESAIVLSSDVSDRDQYGRLLRYVEVNGRDIGEELVTGGFATARRYPPDTARAVAYERAQAIAESEYDGLWAADACGPATDAADDLVFAAVRFDADGGDVDNLNDEWVRLENTGSTVVDLSGWMVKDESATNRYRFPTGFRLGGGDSVTLRTGCGTDTRTDLHWCRSGSAVWNNDGDTAFLIDPSGNVVASQAG